MSRVTRLPVTEETASSILVCPAMESITTIVKDTTAILQHVSRGKVIYHIKTAEHTYQLTLDSLDNDWKTTYLLPEFKTIRLMRWIRKALEEQEINTEHESDNNFIMLI